MASIPPRSLSQLPARFSVEPGNERPTTRPFDGLRASLVGAPRPMLRGLWSDAANWAPSFRPRLTPVPTADPAAALRSAAADSVSRRTPVPAPPVLAAAPPPFERPAATAQMGASRRSRETLPVRLSPAPEPFDAPIIEITPIRRVRDEASRARAVKATTRAPRPTVDVATSSRPSARARVTANSGVRAKAEEAEGSTQPGDGRSEVG